MNDLETRGSTLPGRRVKKGWVYFARLGDDGPIKIGHGVNPRRRVASLTSLSPHVITLLAAMPCDDSFREEQSLHQKLAASRIKGEWFAAGAVLNEMEQLAERFVPLDHLPALHAPASFDSAPSALSLLSPSHADDLGADAVAGVMDRLHRALGDVRGKLLASTALVLAGFASPSYGKQQLIARALRTLGWERGRHRYHGGLLYTYARGTQLEREMMLDVERDSDDRLVVKQRKP